MKILQRCDKLVTNMTLWSQGCSEFVKLLQGCDEVVTRLSQDARTLQLCHNLVISVWEDI